MSPRWTTPTAEWMWREGIETQPVSVPCVEQYQLNLGMHVLLGAGTLTGCVSIPSRHIHSAVGVVHLGDMEQCVDLLLAFAELLPLE